MRVVRLARWLRNFNEVLVGGLQTVRRRHQRRLPAVDPPS